MKILENLYILRKIIKYRQKNLNIYLEFEIIFQYLYEFSELLKTYRIFKTDWSVEEDDDEKSLSKRLVATRQSKNVVLTRLKNPFSLQDVK